MVSRDDAKYKNIKKTFEYFGLFGCYIFAISLLVSRAGENIGIGIVVLALFFQIIIFRKKIIIENKKILFWIFGLYLGMSLTVLFSIGGISSSLAMLGKYVALLGVFLLTQYLTSKKRIIIFIILFMISLLAMITDGLILAEKAFPNISRIHTFGNTIMRTAHPLALSLVFLFSIILYLKLKVKFIIPLFILFFFGFIILILTQTRGAWIAFLIGFLFIIMFHKKKFIIITSFISIIFILFIFMPIKQQVKYLNRFHAIYSFNKDSTNSSVYSNLARLHLWEMSLWTYAHNPLFGTGGNIHTIPWFKKYIKKYPIKDIKGIPSYEIWMLKKTYGGNSHNMYLDFMVRTGIMFYFWIFFLFFVLPKTFMRYKEKIFKNSGKFEKMLFIGAFGGLISFCVSGLTERVNNEQMVLYLFVVMLVFFNFVITHYKKELSNKKENLLES